MMRIRELVKILKKNGCYKTNEGSNHEEWYSPLTKQHFRVPRHYPNELPKGTENIIKKQSGLK